MNSSPWLHSRVSPAICPKCNAPALHRSHAQSNLEERRKRLSGKRPYRCHVCGARLWIDETALRYPTSAEKPMAPGIAGKDVPVPDFQLDDAGYSAQLPLPQQPPFDVPAEDMRGIPDAEHLALGDLSPAVPRGADRPGTAEGLDDSVGEVPDFGEQANRPVSIKVSAAFHHRARNKSAACPACGEYALYRSRARGIGESLRKKLTSKRPYRCHRCGWRGWMKK